MSYICRECGTIGNKKIKREGSTFIEATLFMLGVYPGIKYRQWRDSTVRYVCPNCGEESMLSITVDTLRGQIMKYPLPVDMTRCHGKDCAEKVKCQRYRTMEVDEPDWLFSYVMSLRNQDGKCHGFIDFFKN